MSTPLSPGTVRKVTDEDKEAAAEELVPYLKDLSAEKAATLKRLFGEMRGLKPAQVESIILEIKRRESRKQSA